MIKAQLHILKYNQLWLDYRILSLEVLKDQILAFNSNDDNNTEHYRYATFKNYLQSQVVLSDCYIRNLFEIIQTDPDESMARAMAIDILKVRTLNESQFKLTAGLVKKTFGDSMQKYIDREVIFRANRTN